MVGSTVAERPAAARVGSRLATQVRVLLERWRAVLQSFTILHYLIDPDATFITAATTFGTKITLISRLLNFLYG